MFNLSNKNLIKVILIIIALLILGIYFDIRPKLISYNNYKSDKKLIELKWHNEVNLINQKNNILYRYRDLRKTTLMKNPLLDRDQLTSKLLSIFLARGQQNNLVFELLQPAGWYSYAGVNILSVHIKALGNFLNFVEFISSMNQFNFPIKWINFSLSLQENDRVQMDTLLLVFCLSNTDTVPPIAIKPFSRDPFTAHKLSDFLLTNEGSPRSDLQQQTPLTQIKFVGYLKGSDHIGVLAMLPSGQTLEVMQGDRIGLDKAKVVCVNENEVIVQINKKTIIYRYLV